MDTLTQLLPAVLVIGLLAAAIWALKRASSGGFSLPVRGSSRRRLLEPLDRLNLSPQHSLHIVGIEGRRILIVVHPSGCSVVDSAALPRGCAEAAELTDAGVRR